VMPGGVETIANGAPILISRKLAEK